MTIHHPDEVEAMLAGHPELRAYLEEAARRLLEKFGPGSTIVLDIDSDDPEVQMLVVSATTSLRGSEALARLDEFDNEWWLDQPPAVQTRIITDFLTV